MAPLWFLAQYTFNTSLHLTSVTSNTILSNSSALFTYGLSWALLQEPFVAHKLASILVCATGAPFQLSFTICSLCCVRCHSFRFVLCSLRTFKASLLEFYWGVFKRNSAD